MYYFNDAGNHGGEISDRNGKKDIRFAILSRKENKGKVIKGGNRRIIGRHGVMEV